MNIKEDYVSYEVAKLLKDKGFDEPCQKCYYISTKSIEDVHNGRNTILSSFFISCPTLQMACKWLREVHNWCIEPYRTAAGYLYTISAIPYGSCKCNPESGGDDEDSGQWTTYEGAVEAAIKYVLENLI